MIRIKALFVWRSCMNMCVALIFLALLAAQDSSTRIPNTRIANSSEFIDMAISLGLLSRDQAEEASISGNLDEMAQKYVRTGDIDLLSWQHCLTDTALPMAVNAESIRQVATTDNVGLDAAMIDALHKNIATTINTMNNGSCEEYLAAAKERNEAMTEDKASGLIQTARKSAQRRGEVGPTLSILDSGEAAFIYLWNFKETPDWTAMSAACSQGWIVQYRGEYDDAIKRIDALAYEHLLRVSVNPDYKVWNRTAISRRTIESEFMERGEIVIADYLLYMAVILDSETHIVPHLFRFWWDSSIDSWHPFQLFSTSPYFNVMFMF